MDEIDKSKENIQPLRQGRNTEQLCEALSESRHRKHLAQMQQFEMGLRSYEGDDPLDPWYTYYTWLEQTTTGTGKQGRDILKQCLKNFSGVTQYHSDPRFVDLWLKYMSVQPNRMELFLTVHSHGIGTNLATYYHRWAAELEGAGDLRGADKIYLKGLSVKLDNPEFLQQAHQRFQLRAAKTKVEDPDLDENAPARAVLGRLESRDGRVPVDRTQVRPLGMNKPMEKPIKDQAVFSVFSGGENEEPRRQLMKEIPDERARVENEGAPKRWTDAASGREARSVTTTPFKVLEDPCPDATPGTKLATSKRILQEVKIQKPEAEFPLAYFEPVNDKCKPMYCKDKVYCGGTEFSFEELRAETWQRRRAKAEAARAAKEAKEPKPQPVARKEIIMYETVIDGQEWSYEEIRAKQYFARMQKPLECPVALFEPDNPNQVRMYDRQRVYADNTEYSPEELRARDWAARSQSGLLCQSMTVHTREALATVQDLWQSTRESPPASPPPKVDFNIYQDNGGAPAFEIYSDEPKAPSAAPFEIYSEGSQDLKPAVGSMQATSAHFAVFSDQENAQRMPPKKEVLKPVLQPKFEICTDIEAENKLPSSQGIFKRVLQPKFEIMADEEEDDADEEDNDEEEEPFVPQPLPPLPELPFVPPPADWEANGPEGKENLSPAADTKKSQFFQDADDDTQFIVGPLGCGPVNLLEDITIGLMRKPPPVDSSTPFGHQPQSLLSLPPQEARHTILSPILEMTGESRGSRSGSSSSGASSVSSKAFSFNLKTPGQSLVNEATHHHVIQPVKLELLEEEEEVSDRKDKSLENIIDEPWIPMLRKQLVPFVEDACYQDGALPTPRVGNSIHYAKKTFKLKKCLGEGAYGKVYKAEEPVVLKFIPNDVTAWELHISKYLRRSVPCHLMEYFCEVSTAAVYKNGTILEMPFKSELTLLSLINNKQDISDSTRAFLVHQILAITDALGKAKIIHADIKPDNFLVVPLKFGTEFKYHLQLIDFGRCIDLNLLPDRKFSPCLKGEARCLAMRQQRPWSYDLDLYGAASTIHVVLFIKYLSLIEGKGLAKPTCKPKRFWALCGIYEKLMEVLINPVEGQKVELQEYMEPILRTAVADRFVVNAELDSVFNIQP